MGAAGVTGENTVTIDFTVTDSTVTIDLTVTAPA